jgi:NAD(P)-dependent dehydrogenase (short-subunit alcohol dehydrogenase family)
MSKVAIITGATGNLGKTVSKKMIEAGYTVIGTVKSRQEKQPENDSVTYKAVDLTDTNAVWLFVQEIIDQYGKINAALCLAGGFDMVPLSETNRKELERMINLNFYTAFNIVRPILKMANGQETGNIVLVGAKPVFDSRASGMLFSYVLSKSMLLKLAEGINTDIKNHGFKATVVVPSIIDTPPNREAMPDADFSGWVTAESIAEKMVFVCGDEGRDLRETVLKIYGNS